MRPLYKDIALADLIEDTTIYPRNRVDDTHVSDLVTALRAGTVLPPLVVEETTTRVVDGIHRRRAQVKVYGAAHAVKCEMRRYANEADLFIDAVALNSAHGRKLDRQDQVRIVLRLRDYHIDNRTIAVTLHVPEPVVDKLAVRIVFNNSVPVPSKRGFGHLQGQEVTKEQLQVMGSVRSGEVIRLCHELSGLLRTKLVDLDDGATVGELEKLRDDIDQALQHRND